jgi:predicted esterase
LPKLTLDWQAFWKPNIPPLDCPLAGFLQGGALSLFTGVQLDQALARIVVTSGYLPAASQCKPKHLDVPIWHGHGTMDPILQFGMAEKTKERLTTLGVKEYTLESFPIQHTVSTTEIQKVMQFLAKILPPDNLSKIQLKYPKEISVKELKGPFKRQACNPKLLG